MKITYNNPGQFGMYVRFIIAWNDEQNTFKSINGTYIMNQNENIIGSDVSVLLHNYCIYIYNGWKLTFFLLLFL